MPVAALQHVKTRSADVEDTKDFYVRLGLQVGDRPRFASRGTVQIFVRDPDGITGELNFAP